ncbi:hypothetical protein ACIBAC_15025 [Streptomyces sp. NPDC051362]|uniref:hypothetical protein n=1 Tax=Streptomyces sp. NPDC051362 TaxID=3365651 RepID=UPI003789DE80
MNNTHITRAPRAAQGLNGATAARRHMERTAVIARQLEQIAPGTVRVRIVPVWTNYDGAGRTRTWVVLDGADGPTCADREQHRAAHGLITRMHPGADWTRAQSYDARTGELTLDAPCAPAELTAEAAR